MYLTSPEPTTISHNFLVNVVIKFQKLKHQCIPCALPRLMLRLNPKVSCMFHKESITMEMPLNLVRVTSTRAPRAKMARTYTLSTDTEA